MSAYGALAAWYDALTRDVDYAAFADFYEQCFQQGRGEIKTCIGSLLADVFCAQKQQEWQHFPC